MTLRQERAIRLLSENVGKPLGKVMLEAGYSAQTSRNPKRLTNSKAFQEYIGRTAIDEVLAETLRASLEATKFNPMLKDFEPDHLARLKAVNIVFKLKGIL